MGSAAVERLEGRDADVARQVHDRTEAAEELIHRPALDPLECRVMWEAFGSPYAHLSCSFPDNTAFQSRPCPLPSSMSWSNRATA